MQTIIVDTTPGYRMPTIYFSQGDVGRQFAIDLQSRFGDSLPSSPTVTIQATKPSGLGFVVAADSITNGVATFTLTATMTNEAGRFPAELKIAKNSVVLFTANFYLESEKSAHPEGTTDGDLDSISPSFMSVTTTTLPAGSNATYSFDPQTNTATFGIPKGADGSLASGVLAADYSTSKTYAVGDYVYYSGDLYRCTTAITTAEAWTAGHWTAAKLADDTSALKTAITLLENLEASRGLTAAQIQQIVAAGKTKDYFEIGDIIFIKWTDRSPNTPVEYNVPFVVTHFGDVYDENDVLHEDAMYLQWLYACPSGVQFDAPEAIVETESTFQSGYYYYTKNADNSFTEQTVTPGDVIPSGTTYYKHVRTGMKDRLRYGSNDWSQSAMRQWLNSSGGKGEWWVAQHESDVAPDQLSTMAGFLTGFDEDWLAVFKPIKVQTSANTVCDGGVTKVTYDTFFLPSLEQIYGSPQAAGVEGEYWEYWKEATGLESPSNGSSSDTNDARKIPALNAPTGSAEHVRLRSATRGSAYGTWAVPSTGYLSGYSSAYYAFRALPACVIY